jgi:hypothetical protein
VESERGYVVAAEDLPVPNELLRRLPPHLPCSWSSFLSPSSLLGGGARGPEYDALRWLVAGGAGRRRTARDEGTASGGGARCGVRVTDCQEHDWAGLVTRRNMWAGKRLGLVFFLAEGMD